MRDTRDETEESLDFLYFQEEKLITNFNNVPDSERTKQILRDYYIELNLFDIHIGLQTVILEDDNNRIDRQERVGMDSNQQYNALVSQTIQIPWQLHVLQNGILSQQELIDATLQVIDNYLRQLITAGITRLIDKPIPYNNRGISDDDQAILQQATKVYMEPLQKWIVELYSNNMDEQHQRWQKSELYNDIDSIAPTYNFKAPAIYTIKRYLGNFFCASDIGRHGPISILLTDKMISNLQMILLS